MTHGPVQPEGVAKPTSPYSPVFVSEDLVWTAGQIGTGDDIETQTRSALDNLFEVLNAAGCGAADVIKVNGYLTDLANFDVYNRIYREYFAEPYPARTTVGAALAPGLLVEIEAVARRRS